MTLLEAYVEQLFGIPLSKTSDNPGGEASIGVIGLAKGRNMLADGSQDGSSIPFCYHVLLDEEVNQGGGDHTASNSLSIRTVR